MTPKQQTKPAKKKTETTKTPISQFTPKQRKLIKAKASGKTTREASKIAGLHENYACGLLKQPEIAESIQSIMAKHGLDDASILKVHAEMIQATKGEEKEPDWQARGKGVEMAYKLRGAFTETVLIEFVNSGKIK
jgi:hypothetical protein